jgi:hypothetical protein
MKTNEKCTKDLTDNQLWALCIEMWEWVVSQLPEDFDADTMDPLDLSDLIASLKGQWTSAHGWSLESNCFFCDKTCENLYTMCTLCPGKKVSPHFFCWNEAYTYDTKPMKFLAKLKRMDRQRRNTETGWVIRRYNPMPLVKGMYYSTSNTIFVSRKLRDARVYSTKREAKEICFLGEEVVKVVVNKKTSKPIRIVK